MYFLPVELKDSLLPSLDKSWGSLMLLATAIAVPPSTQPLIDYRQITVDYSLPQIFEILGLGQSVSPSVPVQEQIMVQTYDYTADLEVQYIETRDLPPGMSRVLEEGSPGIYRQVYQVDPVTQEQELLYTYPLQYPQPKVVLHNSQPVIGEKFDLENLEIVREFIAEATAYTHTGYRTASGLYPRYGLIATDPKVIPLGTKLYVEGYGYAIAADTGGAIKGDKVDVFFDTRNRCMQWGRRHVKVYVFAEKAPNL